MVQIVKELTRLKSQTAADDDKMDTLARLLAQAKVLQQVPAVQRTIKMPEICIFTSGIVALYNLGDNPTEAR